MPQKGAHFSGRPRALRKAWSPLRSLALLATLTVCLPHPEVISKERQDPFSPRLYEIVAVGVGPGAVVLGSISRPASRFAWRYRRIPLAEGIPAVRDARLSRGGSKLLLEFENDQTLFFDLTRKIDRLTLEQAENPIHRLPHELFPVRRSEQICLEDDTRKVVGECRTADQLVLHPDGRGLYAYSDGTASIVRPGNKESEPLPYHLPAAAKYKLFSGQPGDQRDFLVLLEGQESASIVDPRISPGILATYDNRELAALELLLRLQGPPTDPTGSQNLRKLAESLVQDYPKPYRWSFFLVQPETALYAPLLEFAKEEPVYTSDVEIWNRVLPQAKGDSKDDLRAAYDALGVDRFRSCTTYYRTASYPGSWLLEFWYYYPFDEGQPHPHIHDSEHVFVEVDKLGGTVRAISAAAHNSINPNNNYSTFLPSARPVELPLAAFVEFEKHAMAPDINRDGRFTRVLDENLHPEWYAVWGVRDLGAKRGHFMEPYRESMSLPRSPTDVFALRDALEYYPTLVISPERAVCRLVPLARPLCPLCSSTMIASAEAHLVDHADAQRPERIYKPWVLPWQQVRIGFGGWDHLVNGDQFYGAYVLDLDHLTRQKLSFPSRLALEAMWSPRTHQSTFQQNSETMDVRTSRVTYVGGRLEQMLTNTQGLYFGADALFDKVGVSPADNTSEKVLQHWRFEEVWYKAGYLLELPTRRYGNFTNYLGVSFPDFREVRFEWRVSFGVFRKRGREQFGIRSADANPYQ